MITLLVGSKLGGVLFDVQQAFLAPPSSLKELIDANRIAPTDITRREQLIASIVLLVSAVMSIDEAESRNRVLCEEVEHDRFGHRKEDCAECTNPRIGEIK